MSSRYHYATTENASNAHFQRYASHDSEEEYMGESEPPQPYAAVLDSVPLGGDEENLHLLDQIDQLRECRIDEYIDLPQIVVVGDQCSGKSSVLDALTNIPFPRSGVWCTRFVTQIKLRRSSIVDTVVKIIPDKDDEEEKRRLEWFSEIIRDEVDFGTIFQRAMEAIFPPGTKASFLSKKILSVEVSGPTQPHLTVVDLPGIIHSATGNQTAADKEDITALANDYIRNERAIILPVVACSSETSSQAILDMAKAVDKKGIRTLGIITKPDMTGPPERESEFITLASNKDPQNKLQLGWHVLRNRTPDETHFTPEERKQKETEFFAESNWGAKLKANQLGVDNLLKRLSTQLIRHIAAEAWKVQADIETALKTCRDRLAAFGDGKDEPEEMRGELFRWCDRSRELTQAALAGHGINPPGAEGFFPSPNDGKPSARNFRSRVVIKNSAFAAHMEGWGAACLIVNNDVRPVKHATKSGNAAMQLNEITRNDYIDTEVIPLLRENPGLELSVDSNPLLVYRLFQSYSKNWPNHATRHIEDIHKLCEAFLREVLHYIWPERLHGRVWDGFILGEIHWRIQKAQMELFMLKADRLKLITPYEKNFPRKYYQWKEEQLAKQISSELPRQKYEDNLTKMLLLYESNLKIFVTNVVVQVIERHIAEHLADIFSDERVRNLTEREVRDLVEDDYEVRIKRQELRAEEAILAEGRKICRQIGTRTDLGPYEQLKFQTRVAPQTPTRSPGRRTTVTTPASTFTSWHKSSGRTSPRPGQRNSSSADNRHQSDSDPRDQPRGWLNNSANEDVGQSGRPSGQDTGFTTSDPRVGTREDGTKIIHRRQPSGRGFFSRGKKKAEDNHETGIS